MKTETQAKLLQAYRYAITACQDGIAELLDDIILEEMGDQNHAWTITRGPDAVPLSGIRPKWMETDHMSKEVTA